MSVTILTTSYKRPKLLKRLADVIVPLINKLNGKLKWKIIIDEITDEYEFFFNEIEKKIENSSLISWNYQSNIGKFKSLVNLINETIDSDWLVNIDDDDILINYKFETFLNQLENADKNLKAIIVPRLILNVRFYHIKFKIKKKLFNKFNNTKMSYFEFKEKFGDIDTTIFLRRSKYIRNNFPEIENDNFTAESLLWLKLFPGNDLLIHNQYLIYSQYLSGGLTRTINYKRRSNTKSAIEIYRRFLEYRKFVLSKFLIKTLINYYRFNLHAKNKINIYDNNYGNLYIRFLSLYFAKFLFFYDNLIKKK